MAATQLVSWGSLYYSFSLFVTPMERELGWSKTDLNGAVSLGLLVSGLCSLPIGSWIDRHGGRLVMTMGSLGGAALLFAWAKVQHLATFYVIWVLMGVVLAAVLYEPACAVLSRAYGANLRKAILMMAVIGGFASTVFIPLTAALIEKLGWRAALEGLALCNLIFCAGIHLYFLAENRARPAPAQNVVESPPLELRGSPLSNAAREPAFWGLLVCFVAYNSVFSAVTFHLIPLLVERNVDPATIVFCVALIGPMQVLGRLLLFLFGAKTTANVLGSFNLVVLPIAVMILIVRPSDIYSLGAFAVLYGSSNGLMTIIRGMAVPDLLGTIGYGAINGALAFPTNIARAAAPIAMAALWTLSHHYGPVLWSIFAIACVSTIAFWFAVVTAPRRPRRLRRSGLPPNIGEG
ncbi:MAG TPA: MFS transporter [Alphaproteobacteria bacterium]|nr:MFS transporter [Alphaproteobacteria bacterium]